MTLTFSHPQTLPSRPNPIRLCPNPLLSTNQLLSVTKCQPLFPPNNNKIGLLNKVTRIRSKCIRISNKCTRIRSRCFRISSKITRINNRLIRINSKFTKILIRVLMETISMGTRQPKADNSMAKCPSLVSSSWIKFCKKIRVSAKISLRAIWCNSAWKMQANNNNNLFLRN